MEITELEFVEIAIIVVVVMVMVVVITCLLSHYKLSARSFIGRHSQGRRREDALSSEGCLWPSESTVSGSSIPEPQVYAPPRPTDRLAVPFTQRDRFHRFQPTYPYLQHEIDLPPTISLSDGEEPPPYQGPCTLQLRDPEQQLELNRESVRAPPNRTIFDSDLMDSAPHLQRGHRALPWVPLLPAPAEQRAALLAGGDPTPPRTHRPPGEHSCLEQREG